MARRVPGPAGQRPMTTAARQAAAPRPTAERGPAVSETWDPLLAHLHHRSTAAWTRRRIATAYLDFVRYFLDARDGTLPVRYEPEDL